MIFDMQFVSGCLDIMVDRRRLVPCSSWIILWSFSELQDKATLKETSQEKQYHARRTGCP
jgi:hypothetical protein